jgi:hypothetical protein
MKQCRRCEQYKQLSDYRSCKNTRDKFASSCKRCETFLVNLCHRDVEAYRKEIIKIRAKADIRRFFKYVHKSEDTSCWIWSGNKRLSKGGAYYGRFKYKGKLVSAHRRSYEMVKGFIPRGLTLDHLCRNTLCVNPSHLEAVTTRENILRGNSVVAMNYRRTHTSHSSI